MKISELRGKVVGVWGYGVVGKSTIAYLRKQGIETILCQAGSLSLDDAHELATLQVQVLDQQKQFLTFLASCDFIIPSSGIDLRPYSAFAHKWLSELDLFQMIIDEQRAAGICPRVVAITGSVGKTTVTHTLYQLLQLAGANVLLGGNIGIGLCDLADKLNDANIVVIEVSSFQLEHCRIFSPDVAVVTNVYANHLDRHGTMQEYVAAKFNIAVRQRPGSVFICDWSLIEQDYFSTIAQQLGVHSYYCTLANLQSSWLSMLSESDTLVTFEQEQLVIFDMLAGIKKVEYILPEQGFKQNWLLIAATLHAMGYDTSLVATQLESSEVLAHRLSTVATINGVTYIDDSKATIMHSTLAAVETLRSRPVVLLLGGLSKGIDRSVYFPQLANRVKAVITFGAEREQLATGLTQYGIQAFKAEDMTSALAIANSQAIAGDVILLSPGGSSYDLYANYKERGKDFAKHVVQLV